MRVYVAGPYSAGNIEDNVFNAIKCGEYLLDAGFVPYVPHLSHYWDKWYHHPYTDWLKFDIEWLKVCDAILRIPGESPGADREVEYAYNYGIPVFYDCDKLIEFRESQGYETIEWGSFTR